MGRAWRIEYEGGLYHVLSRGNERKDIFRDNLDRLAFLDVIGEMADQYRVDIFAYTLNCHLDAIRHSRRMPNAMKGDRDLLVYLVWKACMLSNEETERLFGMTYSAISHTLSAMRTRLKREPDLMAKYNRTYSLCKM